MLTGFPNYPGGRVYSGYQLRWRQQELVDPIKVTRVALYPSHDGSAVRRVVNYASFALSAAAFGVPSVSQADVAYVYHPPATIALPAMLLRVARRVPFVLDVQDLWPDTLRATGMVSSSMILNMVGKLCRQAYRSAAGIAVLSPGFKRTLVSRGVAADKIEVIHNWSNEAELEDTSSVAASTEVSLAGRFNVVFAGTMGRAQALTSVLQAAKLVETAAPRIQFILVGGGVDVPTLRERAAAMSLSNVKFLPARPLSQASPLLHAADLLLVHLRDDPLFEITIPSKTQAYMAVGRPILMAVRGDAATLVREAGAGWCVEPENPHALAARLVELASMDEHCLKTAGERGRKFYQENLSLNAGVSRFEALFRRVTRDHA